MNTEEIERKISQALQLLQEASLALGELKRGEQPAQVMSRIQAAQSMRQPLPVPSLALVPQARKPVLPKKERAHFYLHIAAANDPTNDKIFRVVGDAGLVEANRIQSELTNDPSYKVDRLDSREFQALTEKRLRMVREGASQHVGAMTAEDLRGAVQQ